MESLAAVAVGGRSRRQRGLDPAILETFPTLVYSEVKEHKIGKGALECAICLNEFEDDDTIRLLPKCDHVFHQECIDAWLSNHVTCPVCRTNYSVVDNEGATVAPDPAVPPAAVSASNLDQLPADHVVISVDDEEREDEIRDLARIASKARGNGSRRPRRLPRSHSTGHSIVRQGDCLDRYTLRLPEHVRKEIISAGALQRSRSVAVGSGGEGSLRRGLRGIVGEGSNRRGRSVRLGRSERWPSFVRSLSTKIPAWGNWRRGEDGSVKEPSARGKIAAGNGSKHNPTAELEGPSAAALNRV